MSSNIGVCHLLLNVSRSKSVAVGGQGSTTSCSVVGRMDERTRHVTRATATGDIYGECGHLY